MSLFVGRLLFGYRWLAQYLAHELTGRDQAKRGAVHAGLWVVSQSYEVFGGDAPAIMLELFVQNDGVVFGQWIGFVTHPKGFALDLNRVALYCHCALDQWNLSCL